ncbi:hypothetical protein N8I74_03025 [Chitiniphilus purpureus]|uniref:DNA gyrase subunit B n=1 Tax=Chitiniphilus purpureus TaxID=2981137 RepID=A0ABY6DP61_9NEIS|nr:hypothetical protein [Chitiniphilus sp. CD1]UXY16008.1 hypothetical protein N8I74_03025 [Chitiniphilus sp. CD1]
MTRAAALLPGVLAPLALLLCLAAGWPLWLAGLALLPLAWLRPALRSVARWLGLLAAGLGLLALAARSDWPLRAYPVLVNAALLAGFGYSLRHPPSAIERFARLTEPDLPAAAVAYTRRVTWLWCGFFTVNGALALATGLWADQTTWALYNGGVAYLLMGLLLGGEWLVRRRVRRRAEQHG